MLGQDYIIAAFKNKAYNIVKEHFAHFKGSELIMFVYEETLKVVNRQMDEFQELGGDITSLEIQFIAANGENVIVNYIAVTKFKTFHDNEFGFFILKLDGDSGTKPTYH